MTALYARIDLHSNKSAVVIEDEVDNLVGRQRLSNDLRRVSSWLESYRDELAGVVVESTYNCYRLAEELMEQGYPVRLANTVTIQPQDAPSCVPSNDIGDRPNGPVGLIHDSR